MADKDGIRVRRVRETPEPGDGARVLVDGLWPRGLAKADADFDEWLKAVAPSTDLRRWYGHQPERFPQFAERYRDELAEGDRAAAVDHLGELTDSGPLTLLTATRDLAHAHATVLAEELRQRCGRTRRRCR